MLPIAFIDSFVRVVPAITAPAQSSTCTVADSASRIDHLSQPVYSEAMKARHKAGIVDVTVSLEPNGTISRAVVTQSSGDELLDAATYAAATATTYVPEVRGCTYLAGSYIFRARYRALPSTGPTNAPAGPPAFAPAPVRTFGPVPYASGAASARPVSSVSPSAH